VWYHRSLRGTQAPPLLTTGGAFYFLEEGAMKNQRVLSLIGDNLEDITAQMDNLLGRELERGKGEIVASISSFQIIVKEIYEAVVIVELEQ
jgi:hypothetical protein